MKKELVTIIVILAVVAVGFKLSITPEKTRGEVRVSEKRPISREAPPNIYASAEPSRTTNIGGNPVRNKPTPPAGPSVPTSFKRNHFVANKALANIQNPSQAALNAVRRNAGKTPFRSAVDRALKRK